jgi:hypothetical protein
MARFYFEMREDGTCISDLHVGEGCGVETARVAAARALVDIAKDVLCGAIWQDMSIEIRDEVGRAVLWADIFFSADQPEPRPPLN